MKKKVSVYHYRYLPGSQTFIYRQILGLSRFFDIKLITHNVENLDEFTGIEPLLLPPGNFLKRMAGCQDGIFGRHLTGSSLFHVNFGHIALGMQRYALRAGIPMTAYFHGVDASAFLKSSIYRYRLMRSCFEAVFVISNDMKIRLTPFLPAGMKCLVVYCGIPLERFPYRQRRTVPAGATFLQISRLDEKKGLDITLQAFGIYVRETDPKARLIIAGDGHLKMELQKLACRLNLNEQVIFSGYVGYKKCLDLLQTADVFLHPSVTAVNGDMEGLPIAVCEAMATGLPVISTRHSGIPEVIDDGKNGFLTEEKDIEGLFGKMVALRTADIGDISRNARVTIMEKFDQDKNIALLAKYLDSIMSMRNV